MRQALKLHPDSHLKAVRELSVDVTRVGEEVRLAYELSGDLAALALPPISEPRRVDDLWRHTCFEAFLRADEADEYCEFNFAPSTQWAAYRFSSYRKDMSVAEDVAPPRIAIFGADDVFTMSVRLKLPGALKRAALHAGVSAVIEHDGGLSYWALAHPSARADFHHADSFVLTLPAEAS